MTNISSGLAEVDGAKFSYEVRGRGPALLMISGAGDDAGHYSQAAAILEDSFTVITRDRRGNSRNTAERSSSVRANSRRPYALLPPRS